MREVEHVAVITSESGNRTDPDWAGVGVGPEPVAFGELCRRVTGLHEGQSHTKKRFRPSHDSDPSSVEDGTVMPDDASGEARCIG
jgi:hypothetical protein